MFKKGLYDPVALDKAQQNGDHCNNQQDMNDSTCTVGKISDCPKNDQHYGDDIK